MKKRRRLFLAVIVLVAVAASWLLRVEQRSVDSPPEATEGRRAFVTHNAPAPPSSSQPPRPAPLSSAEHIPSSPIDVAARERFNDEARAFFANASALSAEQRAREARDLERQLARLEQAGGLSAGETLLVRIGLIKVTVSDPAQQDAQIKALQERYKAETQRRLAATRARPDPQFESYKVREGEIVAEVMAMDTIPEGLSRDEYLRRRLQAAREQFTPQ